MDLAKEALARAAAFAAPLAVSAGAAGPREASRYLRAWAAWLGVAEHDAISISGDPEVSPATPLHIAAASVVALLALRKVWNAAEHKLQQRATARHFSQIASKRQLSMEQLKFEIVGEASVQRDLVLEDVPLLYREMRQSVDSGIILPLAKRREQLLALHKLFTENEEAMREALKEDLGKPGFEALSYDYCIPLNEIDTMLSNLENFAAPEAVGTDFVTFPSKAHIYREPLGLVLVIGTWNFPIQLAMVPVIGAIAAGNCVVLKPCNVAMQTAKLLDRLIRQYLDPRVVACIGPAIDGDRHTTAALLEHQWDHIFFTGSPTVGKIVYEGAARHLTPVTLELGGKNPVFVDASANVKLAAKRIVWARMINAGQQCIAPDFVMVHEKVLDAFQTHVKHYIETFYKGSESKENERLGKIVGNSQFRRVVEMLRTHDGKILIGGDHDEATRWIAPTAVILPGFGNPVLDEETFGPILWIVGVSDMNAAVEYQQFRPKPLACYIFAGHQEVIDSILYAVPAGGVTVNSCLWHAAHHFTPFGGVGTSGIGSYHGAKSFEIFSHLKPVVTKAAWGTWDSAVSDPFILYPPAWSKMTESVIKLYFAGAHKLTALAQKLGF